MKSKIDQRTVFVLDDNDEFRESTIWLLESMGYHVEGFAVPEPVIARITQLDQNVKVALLLDIRMPVMSGFDVHDLLNEHGITTPVIYMTAHGAVSIAVTAMSKGAVTLLEKPFNDDALYHALETAFSQSIQLRRRVRTNHAELAEVRQRLSSLTKREGQIVQGILADMNNQSLADEFNISVKTVELYRSKVMAKLAAKNAAHLVRMVMTCDAV